MGSTSDSRIGAANSASPVTLPSVTDARLRKVLRRIEEEVSLSINELARSVSLSSAHVERLFKQETGMRIRVLQAELRMQKAANLLATTYMEVKEIAYAVGYKHQSSFDRAFQRRFGEPPTMYRQKCVA